MDRPEVIQLIRIHVSECADSKLKAYHLSVRQQDELLQYIAHLEARVKELEAERDGPEFYIVWNEARNEGFVTDDLGDAEQAAGVVSVRTISSHLGGSAVGECFGESYDDDVKTIERHTLPVIPEAE